MNSNAQKVIELLKPLKISELFEIIKTLEVEYGVKISVRINSEAGEEDLQKEMMGK
jgi:ribosomal protein L7/L12